MAIKEYTIAQVQDLLHRSEITSVSLCEHYLDRIATIDWKGAMLRSVIEVNPDALTIAEALDQERREKGVRGPLHGIPILVKDSIDTGDRMMTTGGSLALEGNFAPSDAFIVSKLRDAGAIILGKTNMSEWGYMRSTRACSGWSSRGGQTRNPYHLLRSPLGSSSGSAAAVAANFCMGSLGAEVDGSIVRPASSNSIVGIKPTVGLLSRSGIIGVAPTQDTAGPMARCVADAATLLTALAGRDAKDPATHHNIQNSNYQDFLDPNALQGARLGIARECFGQHEGTDAIIEEAIHTLKELGAELIDPVTASSLPFFGNLELELFLLELEGSINRYVSNHPKSRVKNLAEIIQFNKDHAEEVMPYFQQEFFEMALQKGGRNNPNYRKVVEECRRLARDDGIDKALRDLHLDAIIAPTEGSPPFMIDPIVGDHLLPGGCSTPPAMAGYPHITVPAGYVHQLPVGLSFFSGPFQEGKLIAYAYAFEQATKVRTPPQFSKTRT